jgi:nucleotide-binding universal stress UspA family protein
MSNADRIIIAGVDGSDTAGDALALARSLAEAFAATVLATSVHPDGNAKSVLDDDKYGEAMRELADSVHSHMRDLGVPVEDRTLRLVADRSSAGGLQRTAEGTGAALIAVGSSRRSRIGRVFPGGTAERLLAGSPCPVAIAPRGFAAHGSSISVIGCAFDGREESRVALTWARDLATATEGDVHLLAVHEPVVGVSPAVSRGVPLVSANAVLRRELGRELARAEDEARDCGIKVEGKLLEGEAAGVLERESHGLDLLVTGSRGYGPVRAVLVGSVSSALVRTAECPVVVVPRGP